MSLRLEALVVSETHSINSNFGNDRNSIAVVTGEDRG